MIESPKAEVPKEVRAALDASGSNIAVPKTSTDVVADYDNMLQKINSWGRALLLLGVVQMIASGILSAAWGVLLLLVGAVSFYFKDAAMFMVYAMTILWAGVSNLLAGGWIWIGYGLLQFYWAYGLLRDFLRFRHVQDGYVAYLQTEPSKGGLLPLRARRIFPWASFILGVLVLAGVIAIFVLMATAQSSDVQPGSPLYVLFDVLPNLAVLGMAIGLASFLMRYPFKLLAAIGMLACSLVILAWLALLLL